MYDKMFYQIDIDTCKTTKKIAEVGLNRSFLSL